MIVGNQEKTSFRVMTSFKNMRERWALLVLLHISYMFLTLPLQKTANKSETQNVPRINNDHSSEDDTGVEMPTKPKRGRPSNHMKNSKTKQKAESTTLVSPITPQLTKEAELNCAEVNRYNLRSTLKKYGSGELQNNSHDVLHILTSNTSSSIQQPGELPPSANIHKPEPDLPATEISQVKTRLELKFDCKEVPQMQLNSSIADKTKAVIVSVPSATKIEEHSNILHEKKPSRVDHAEYYFVLSIVIIGILGYVLTV